MFSEINGLPLHPLVVHAVVVLVPLSTLGALAVVVRRQWARTYGPLVALGAAGAAVTAWVAKLAGDAFALAIGATGDIAQQIADHGRWGLYTAVSTTVFALFAVAATAAAFAPGTAASRWQRPVAAVAALAGVVATLFTVLAGDSGASAVWGSLLDG